MDLGSGSREELAEVVFALLAALLMVIVAIRASATPAVPIAELTKAKATAITATKHFYSKIHHFRLHCRHFGYFAKCGSSRREVWALDC